MGGSSHGKNHNRLDSIGAPDLLWTLSNTIPYGTHTDSYNQACWYPGGKEVYDQILADIKALLNQ